MFCTKFRIFKGHEDLSIMNVNRTTLMARKIMKTGKKIYPLLYTNSGFSCRETLTYDYISAWKFAKAYPKAFAQFDVELQNGRRVFPQTKEMVESMFGFIFKENEDGNTVVEIPMESPVWYPSIGFLFIKENVVDFKSFLEKQIKMNLIATIQYSSGSLLNLNNYVNIAIYLTDAKKWDELLSRHIERFIPDEGTDYRYISGVVAAFNQGILSGDRDFIAEIKSDLSKMADISKYTKIVLNGTTL